MLDPAQALVAILNDQTTLLSALNDALESEASALSAFHLEDLRCATSVKRDISEKIIFSEKQLKFLLMQNNALCISDLINKKSGIDSDELQSLRAKVLELHEKTAQQNEKNRLVTERSLRRTRGAASFLRRAISQNCTYTAKGDMSSDKRNTGFTREF